MRLEGSGFWGAPRWPLLIAAAVAIFFSVGWGGRRVVVSTWPGDAVAQAVAPAQRPPQTLAGVFTQRGPSSTNLAKDPRDPNMPWGNPTDSTAVVLTQGYGIGTHAPAATWGALDIAIDGNGDGAADPKGSDGAPVYATQRGVVEVTPNSYPAGNHIWVRGERYKTGYSHLKGFAVKSGQVVERGTLIGYMGSTGASTGPHLDYQVWKDGVNQNPFEYGAMDGAKW